MDERKDPILPLTALRFPAAALVFASHFATAFGDQRYHCMGYLGVTFFYILSGFVLSFRYKAAFSNLPSKKRLLGFYRARFARVYPLHYLTFLIWALAIDREFIAPLTMPHAAVLLQNLSLLQSWLYQPVAAESLNRVAWSISNEAFFYAVFPFVLLVLHLMTKNVRRGSLIFIIVGIWLYEAFVACLPHNDATIQMLNYFPLARLPDFVIGMTLGLLHMRSPQQPPRWSDAVATRIEAALLMMMPIVAAMLWLLPQRFSFNVATVPYLALTIFVFAQQRGRVSAWISSRDTVYLGETSFAFYMIHLIVLVLFIAVVGSGASFAKLSFVATGAFAISLLCSFALHEFVEKPMRDLILAKRPPQPGGTAVPSIEGRKP